MAFATFALRPPLHPHPHEHPGGARDFGPSKFRGLTPPSSPPLPHEHPGGAQDFGPSKFRGPAPPSSPPYPNLQKQSVVHSALGTWHPTLSARAALKISVSQSSGSLTLPSSPSTPNFKTVCGRLSTPGSATSTIDHFSRLNWQARAECAERSDLN